MSAALRIPGMIIWLVVLWVALWGSITWANVLGGLVVASVVVLVARLGPRSLAPSSLRPHWALWYALVLFVKLVQSNLRIAWDVLTPGDRTHTAIVAVPMRGGSEAVVTLVANSITLTPGTMTLDVRHHDDELDLDELEVADVGGGVVPPGVTLYVHCMYAADVEAVRHEVLELEALALRAFGSGEDYRRAAADVVEHEALMTEPRTVDPSGRPAEPENRCADGDGRGEDRS